MNGIVRRIDDLGRIVIPKEVRRALKIKEGQPIVISTNQDGQIILEKYNHYEEMLRDITTFFEKYNGLIPEKAQNAFIRGCDVIRERKEKGD